MTKTKASDGQRTGTVRKHGHLDHSVPKDAETCDAATGSIRGVKTSRGAIKGVRHEKKGGILARIQNMSPEEFRESLLAAGIITKSGQLTKPYRG